MESMPNIQARIVNYTMANGTEVTQQRFYTVDENNKWRQIKNTVAREQIVDGFSAFTNSIVAPAPVVTEQAPAHVEGAALKADAPVEAKERWLAQEIADKQDLRAKAEEAETKRRQLVAAPVVGAAAVGRKGWISRAKEGFASAKERVGVFLNNLTDKLEDKKRWIAASTAGLIALGGLGILNHNNEGITLQEAQVTASTPQEDRPAPTRDISAYQGETTGAHSANEIGFFDIDPSNPNKSLENMYAELRMNSDAQAFWAACLETGTPGYDVCVEKPEVLAKANKLAEEYRGHTLKQKAVTAESIIAKFKKAEFKGVTVESGYYQTVAVGNNGEFVPSGNTRTNDPRLRFEFKGKDGKIYEVEIRSCVQITESQVRTPEVTPPTTTPPTTVPETTTTTVPETTTTTVPETTTTTSTTTSTSTTTTSTTIPTTTSTSTTIPTTTTRVTVPKTRPTYPEGEERTNVTVGRPTPANPTTSTVPPETTLPTNPANTTDTSVPAGGVENHVDNASMIGNISFPLSNGEIVQLTFGSLALALAAKKRLQKEREAARK